MKYYIYARKSTESEEKQVQSIDAQLVELRKYAREHNLEIIDELIEKRTAKMPGRPVFNQMIKDFENGKVEGVICWAPDRISRNPVDAGTFQWLLSTGKIKDVQFVTQQFTNDPSGKFLLNLGFAQGQQYVESLSVNTKRGLDYRAKSGWYPAKAPLGYKNDIRTKRIEVDPKLTPVIKEMFELYSEGQTSYSELSKWLFERKIKSSTGKKLHSETVKFMLTNIFYTGIFKYSGEIYEGKHKPIISNELFDKVQKVVQNRGYTREQPKNVSKPYCGLMTCRNCGMSITATTKHNIQKNGNYHEWTYYHCSKRHKSIKCDEPFVREEVLDEQLSELIRKCQLSSEGAKFILEQIAADYEVSAQAQNEIHADIQEQLEGISRQLVKITDVYLDDDIDREEYLKRKVDLVNSKRDLQSKITTKPIQVTEALEPVKKFLKTAQTLGKLADGDYKIAKKFACANLAGWNLSLGSALAPAGDSLVGQGASRSNVAQTHQSPVKQGKTAAVGVNFQRGIEGESPWRHLFEAAFAADQSTEIEKW